jgi:signal transduction histidine kinase/ligand-binding sensor domain-containing protein
MSDTVSVFLYRIRAGISLTLKIRQYFIIFFCIFCVNIFAQQYQFVYYTPRDGLINSRVRSIKQDSKGRMLFLTYGGLSIYDGVQFHNYNQQEGLANELVNDVLEISPDTLLIATNAPSLNILTGNSIGNFHTSDGYCPVINRFLKSKDGSVYAVADEGLFKMSGRKFTKIPLLEIHGKDIGTNLDRIVEWDHYFLIIPWNAPQHEKLIIYDKSKNKVAGSITHKRIVSMAVTLSNDLWVSSENGIELMDLPSLHKGEIVLRPLTDSYIGKEWQNAFIYLGPNGNALLFHNDAVMKMEPGGKKNIFSSQQGLNTSNLADLFIDRENILWMGSDGNGIVKMTGTDVQILSDLIPGTKNDISSIHQESDTIWTFNCTDQSIYRINHNIVSAFPLRTEEMYLTCIYSLKNAIYFIADNILYHVNNKNDRASYLRPGKIFPDTVQILELGIGITDPNGNIIQNVRKDDSTFYLAIIRDEKVFMRFMLTYMVDQLAIDSDGHLWVVMRDNQLQEYSLHPDDPSRYLKLLHDYSSEIQGIGPRSITTDKTGDVWIGTRYNGIHMLDFEQGRINSTYKFTTAQGLTDNFEYYLHCDEKNNIWIGSRTGLDRISLEDDQYIINNITKTNGIFQGIYKIINAGNGKIWALMSNGNILSISGKDPPSGIEPPPLLITQFTVNDSIYPLHSSTFHHNENNFSIDVAAASFLDEQSIHYSFLLEGGSKTRWSEPSNSAHFNFINLSPGDYILHIRAEFPGKIYPTQTIKHAFVIQSPYWKTWWFIAVSILFLLGFIGFIVQDFYTRKLETQKIRLENKQAIEKERTRIATDMHDDLGAGLSRIKFLSEIMGIKKQKQLPIEDDIQHIRHYADDMIDKMGEIVWALNEKNDSLSDLLSYTRAYAVEYLSENGINSKIEKLPQLTPRLMKGEFRRNIYLCVKEALHNVVKHSRATGVSMNFIVSKNLVITIKDDGIGFDPENAPPFRNGINNIRKRMSEIHGKVDIINDHGTSITLTAPLSE